MAAAEKYDHSEADLGAEEQRLAKLEGQVAAAEALIDAAQKRHATASKKVAEELAKPLNAPATASISVPSGPGLTDIEAKLPSDSIAADAASKDKGLHGAGKNTSAKSEKEVGRDRWLANRATESRVKTQAKKIKDKQRSYDRGKRGEFNRDLDGDGPDGMPAAAAAPAEDKEKGPFVPPERSPLFESDEIKQGARGLADRLASLKDRPNKAEKRAAALKVLCGGRENYYTAQPQDVLADLAKHGLVDAASLKELDALVRQTAADKGGPIPQDEWLAHAKKVGELERKDDAPYKEGEVQYLKWVDRAGLLTAEAELDEAEQRLEELLRQVDACLPVDDEPLAAARKVSAEQAVDVDYAADLEDKYDPERQSKGQKNASALSDKKISSDKWVKERGVENRDFEKNVKARDARRGEARDSKTAGGDVGQ